MFGQETLRCSSEIEKVTVYQAGVQIQRTAQINLPPGQSQLVITGMTETLDPATLQVSANKAVKLLSVSHRLAYDSPPPPVSEIQALEDQLQTLTDKIRQNKDTQQVLAEEKTMIQKNQEIGGRELGVKITELAAAAEFWRSRLNDIASRQFALEVEARELIRESGQIAGKISELGGATGKRLSEVVLQIDAKTASSSKFTLRYYSKNAGWEPNYDIRVKDIDQPLSIDSKARIFQTTGYDWENVALTLSTGNPREMQSKPVLQPWYLSFNSSKRNNKKKTNYEKNPLAVNPHLNAPYNPNIRKISGQVMDENGEPLPFATVHLEGTTNGVQTDFDGMYELMIPVGSPQQVTFAYIGFTTARFNISRSVMNVTMAESTLLLESVMVTSSSSRIEYKAPLIEELDLMLPPEVEAGDLISTKEYVIKDRYSIPSTGKRLDVLLEEIEMPATFEYHCVPKLDPGTFLIAKVNDWDEYQLLSGKASIFYETTFIGKTYIDLAEVENSVIISLGRDDNVVVERQKVKDQSKSKWYGSKKKITKAWRLTARNKKSKAIRLLIEDQIPVSQDDDIEVELQKDSGAKLFEKSGLMVWTLDLGPNSNKELDFKFEIRHPKRRVVK